MHHHYIINIKPTNLHHTWYILPSASTKKKLLLYYLLFWTLIDDYIIRHCYTSE
jgi:hypothetical protein